MFQLLERRWRMLSSFNYYLSQRLTAVHLLRWYLVVSLPSLLQSWSTTYSINVCLLWNGKRTRMQKVFGTFLTYKVLHHLYSSLLRHSYSSHLLPSSTSSFMTDMRVIENRNRLDKFCLFIQSIKYHKIYIAHTFRPGQYVLLLLLYYQECLLLIQSIYSFQPISWMVLTWQPTTNWQKQTPGAASKIKSIIDVPVEKITFTF